MDQFTKDSFSEDSSTAWADSFMPMVISTSASGSIIKQAVLESTYTSTDLFTLVNGKTTNNMAMVLKPGVMEPAMKVHTSKVVNKVKESLPGVTDLCTMEIF